MFLVWWSLDRSPCALLPGLPGEARESSVQVICLGAVQQRPTIDSGGIDHFALSSGSKLVRLLYALQ